MKSTLILGILIASLSSASLTADLISAKSDGIMKLPTFFVCASDSESGKCDFIPLDTDWKFQKSLSFQSSPDVITVKGPGDAVYSIPTLSIQTSLINVDIAGG